MPKLRSGKDTVKKHHLRSKNKKTERLEAVFEIRKQPNRIKKDTVANKDLGLTGGGLYAICPYDFIDNTGRAIIKIGLSAKSLDKRFDNYHTYFPMGFYFISILEKPVIRNGLDISKSLYHIVEKEIIENVLDIDKKSVRVYSTTRQGTEGIGNTEWVYALPNAVTQAFHMAQKKYGGEINTKHKKFDNNNIHHATRKIRKGNFITTQVHFGL